MRRFFSLVFDVLKKIFYPQSIDGNESNLDHFQHIYRRSDAENISSVRLVVCEEISSQTDGRSDGWTDRQTQR